MHNEGHLTEPGARVSARLGLALGVTVTVLLAQVVGSIVTGSLALLADTAHAAIDSAGLAIAAIAAAFARRPASARHTWGLRRLEVVGALAQGLLLVGVGGYVIVEAVRRLTEPHPVPGPLLVLFGALGLLGNAVSFVVLYTAAPAAERSLGLRAALLEVLADALGSVGVIVAAIAIWFGGLWAADAVAALGIGLLIVPRAIVILRQVLGVLLEGAPAGIDTQLVEAVLVAEPEVVRVHDLHLTMVATGLPVLTAHVVISPEYSLNTGVHGELLERLTARLRGEFGIEHATLQLEPESPETQKAIWRH